MSIWTHIPIASSMVWYGGACGVRRNLPWIRWHCKSPYWSFRWRCARWSIITLHNRLTSGAGVITDVDAVCLLRMSVGHVSKWRQWRVMSNLPLCWIQKFYFLHISSLCESGCVPPRGQRACESVAEMDVIVASELDNLDLFRNLRCYLFTFEIELPFFNLRCLCGCSPFKLVCECWWHKTTLRELGTANTW